MLTYKALILLITIFSVATCHSLKLAIINDIHLDTSYTPDLAPPRENRHTMGALRPKTYVGVVELFEKVAKMV